MEIEQILGWLAIFIGATVGGVILFAAVLMWSIAACHYVPKPKKQKKKKKKGDGKNEK